MIKKFMITLAVFAAIGIGLYFYMYKEHRDISSEKADFALTVSDLQQEFTQNSTDAGKKYSDKTLEVSGKITAVDAPNHSAVIDDQLSVVFRDSVLDLTVQKQVKVKGRFVGYDDLLEQFRMDQASLSE